MSSLVPRSAVRAVTGAATLLVAAALPALAQPQKKTTTTTTVISGGEVARVTSVMPTLKEPVSNMYTPAKIAAVASVSNMSEIRPSEVALTKAQDQQVRAFAQRMIDEHARLENAMQAMLKQKGITPEHNAYSYQLQQNLGPMMQQLNAATGRDFDRLYMSHQVASHMATLNALDTTLIPQATDPEMKAMLQTQVRPAVADHYQQALSLRDQVARGGMQNGTQNPQ